MKLISLFTKSTNSFDGKEDGEKVILLVRQHPFFVIVRIILFLFMALVPVVVGINFYGYLHLHKLFSLFLFVSSVWYLILWSGVFYSLTMYTLNVWIVTDRRIIDSTQNGFFNRTVSELHLSRVQDTSAEVRGIIQTFLKFGDLHVQTAGSEEKFRFVQVPHPEKIKDEIMSLVATSHHHV